MAQVQMRSAVGFIDSIAVNTHVGYAWNGYDNAALVIDSLKYLGVDTVRDAFATLPQAQPLMLALAAAGYKFDLIVSSGLPGEGSAALGSYVAALEAFAQAHPGSIVALEGLNEANIQTVSYQGLSPVEAAGRFQADFYAAVKGANILKDIPVYNLSLGHDDAADYAKLGDMSLVSDYANAHAYVSTNSTVSTALTKSLGLSEGSAGEAPSVITETGYTTLAKTADVGASETAQAKNILNTLVDAFSRGVEKTYLYELLDRGGDPGMVDKEAHFGLFNIDGTPKLAASAIHNLTHILADEGTGSQTPTTVLDYSLKGLPAEGGSMVLAKSNGAYELIVWNAPKVWNDALDRDIVNATVPVTVDFGAVQAKVYVYDPLGGSAPIAVYDNVSQIVLPILDHPLIVEIGGPGPQGVAPVVTPAVVSGTAGEIVAQLDMLNASTTLQKIALTDSHDLQVASKPTLDYMLERYASALSKIEGDVTFSITMNASNWQLIERYDEAGKLLSTKNSGIDAGFVTSEQTKFTSGLIETVSYDKGVKTAELIQRADGSREETTFAIKGQPYVTEHASYDSSGALLLFERLHSDGTLAFTEVRADGHKTGSWYDADGVIATTFDTAPDGMTTSTVYAAGQITNRFVAHPDKTQENTSYSVTGQSYVSEVQKVDASGRVFEVTRSHADGSLDYHWLLQAGGTAVTTSHDAAGRMLRSVTIEPDGQSFTNLFVAETGALDKQIAQRPDGYYSTTVYTAGVKSAVYVENADRSKATDLYAADGSLSSTIRQSADGHVETKVYAGGELRQLYVVNADGTQQYASYNIAGQSYVTEVQNVDASGRVVEVARSHADGSRDYYWQLEADGDTVTTNYDGAGRTLRSVTIEADGDSFTDLFVAGSTVLDKQIAQRADGYYATTVYTAGVKTALYVENADGSKATDLFTADGSLSSTIRQATNGHVETAIYDNGALTKLYIVNADGTRQNESYNVAGQSYVSEVQKVDASGRVVEVTRSHADGSRDYHWQLGSDGDTVTTSYDDAGRTLRTVTIEADGDSFTDLFVAGTGALDKQITQRPDGYYATTVYTAGVKTALYVENADGSKATELFANDGSLSSTIHQSTDGHVETAVYDGGTLSKLYIVNADGTRQNESYNVAGQSYVSEIQKVDAGGRVIEITRSHADGSSDYHWQVEADGDVIETSYDGAGHALRSVTIETDGDSFTDLFVAGTGALDKQIAQRPDGHYATTVYTAGVKTALYVENADGSKATDLFANDGSLSSTIRQSTDGHVETKVYSDGVLKQLYVVNADGTQQYASYNVAGQSYVSEVQSVDASGRVVEVTRGHADGSRDYHWQLEADGDAVTTNYDAAGQRILEEIRQADGAKDIFSFVVAGEPGTTQWTSYDASGALLLVDNARADGTHQLFATAPGVTLQGGAGDDQAHLVGRDTFVFSGGNDKVTGFHADEAGTDHDLIQVSKAFAVDFTALQLSQVGSDTLVSFNGHDSILLAGVAVGHVNAADFLFV